MTRKWHGQDEEKTGKEEGNRNTPAFSASKVQGRTISFSARVNLPVSEWDGRSDTTLAVKPTESLEPIEIQEEFDKLEPRI